MSDQASNSLTRKNGTRWERAYETFETPQEELHKFLKRLRAVGADQWPRTSRVLEVCSGRGNGLRAWQLLGFTDLIGVDHSPALAKSYRGPGRCLLGDARSIPLTTASRDVVVIQGGLHHLHTKSDIELALSEMRRVVSPRGRIIIIEPWLTPFLRVVHAVSTQKIARRVWPKLDALATMVEEEGAIYQQWLDAPEDYLELIRRYVTPHAIERRWGKLMIVGAPVVQS